ncbi:sugar ABC transporter permease [Streptacidiphilus pinicola]|uniref:Sugar ABC transporter permease n=1 Tax=Streptacidiphilus pinicola TaxID=2219663 RepID=A0A2X0I8P5_9ACTN|nr:sugar ABC transporter permease [Streptacidiphilus pinicola]RAG81312.1 sugar ABC transporter permease [Streptacidiphilus pinicola]
MAILARPAAARRAPHRAAASGGGRPRSRTRGAAALLLGPFFLLFTAATLAPIGYALWLSLFKEHHSGLGFGAATTVFSGLGNYLDVLKDPVYRDGFVHVALFAVLYVPLMLGGSLAVALLLDSALARAKRFFQLTLFLPHVVPGIIAAIVWLYLYTPGVSPIVSALQSGGVNFDLGSPFVAVPSLVNVAIWEVLGYNVVVFYAALQAIPREVLEAALIDGASELRTSWSIKLPAIRSSVGLVGLFTAIGVLQLFQEPLLMQQTAPAVITSTWTPNLYNYAQAFKDSNYGFAAAGSILLAIVCALLSYGVTRLSNPWRRA